MTIRRTFVGMVAALVLVALGWAFVALAKHSIDRDFRKADAPWSHPLPSEFQS